MPWKEVHQVAPRATGTSPPCPRRRGKRRGAMLVEVAIAMPIVLVALGLFVRMLVAGKGMRSIGQEEWSTSSAAQDALERMRNEDFRDVFVLFNSDPFDDPGGPGTAPGHRFAVQDLLPLTTAADGMVGEILLPAWNAGTELSPEWQIREDIENTDLGTPRDLSGDSIIDDQNHADDYSFLPVIVRLRWQGRHGPRVYELHTALSELR